MAMKTPTKFSLMYVFVYTSDSVARENNSILNLQLEVDIQFFPIFKIFRMSL